MLFFLRERWATQSADLGWGRAGCCWSGVAPLAVLWTTLPEQHSRQRHSQCHPHSECTTGIVGSYQRCWRKSTEWLLNSGMHIGSDWFPTCSVLWSSYSWSKGRWFDYRPGYYQFN